MIDTHTNTVFLLLLLAGVISYVLADYLLSENNSAGFFLATTASISSMVSACITFALQVAVTRMPVLWLLIDSLLLLLALFWSFHHFSVLIDEFLGS